MSGLNLPNAYYAARVAAFIAESPDSILGTLTARSAFAVDLTQRDAWLGEISILKAALAGVVLPEFDAGTVLLEFDVPRIGSRIDAVLVAGPAVFVIEFKVGESKTNTQDYNQVWDYALDLKNFHQASHNAPIIPILVPTQSDLDDPNDPKIPDAAHDGVHAPVVCGAQALGTAIRRGLERVSGEALNGEVWARAPYQPTPTIIEAAQALYANHSVDAITRNEAGARNLGVTSRRVEALIEEARLEGRKAIIFVTGVPGAGKTLVGLNVATRKRSRNRAPGLGS